MKMRQQLNQLNKRALIFLSIAVVLLIVITCDQLSFNPFASSSGSLNEELELKKNLFVKYNAVIGKRELYEKQLLELKDRYSSLDTRFIKSKTEDLAQAQLQDYVKGVARKSGLIISRSSAKNVEILNDDPQLLLVYARVEIKEIDKIKKLQKELNKLNKELLIKLLIKLLPKELLIRSSLIRSPLRRSSLMRSLVRSSL